MRLARNTTSIAPRVASDQFFTGRLFIVDVRSHSEFEQLRVPGAMHIPLGQLRRRLNEIRTDRPAAFVCRSGHRSAIAARCADVATVTGGMNAWLAAGLPVYTVRSLRPVEKHGQPHSRQSMKESTMHNVNVEAVKQTAAKAKRDPTAMRTTGQRFAAFVSSAVAAVLGIAPHVLHHAGPLAGSALLGGTGGSLLFGAVGFLVSIPFLLRVHRRRGNWRVPGALLAVMAIVFSISAFVVGPAISGSDGTSASKPTSTQTAPGATNKTGHDAHHH